MGRKWLIDRARDLFLFDENMTLERATLLLQAEYPEFNHDTCQEAAQLVVKVRELLNRTGAKVN